MSKKRTALKISLIVANVLLLVGLGFSSVFFYLKYNNLKNKSLTSDQRIARYEKEIAKTYALPSGEKPTLYDVTQADSLKKEGPNKDFFKDAENGDILMLYNKAKLGVLYRPSTKKLIKVGPAAVTQQAATELIGAEADRQKAASVIKSAFASTINVTKQAEPKSPLLETVVVDVTGSNEAVATSLANELKGKVGSVPDGQEKPADGVGIAVYIAGQ